MSRTTVVIALSLAAGTCHAQPSFDLLGTLPGTSIVSEARGVSDDGSTVAGWSGSTFYYGASPHAFRWSHSTGIEDLDPLAPEAAAWAISGDGQAIAGLESSTGSAHAFLWTRSGPNELYHGGEAEAVSRDGSVVGGFAFDGGSHSTVRRAIRWTTAQSRPEFIDVPNTTSSEALAVSPDGGTLVGYAVYTGLGMRAFRWTEAGGMQNIGSTAANGPASRALGVSADGSVIVGYTTPTSTPRAVAWTATGTMDLGAMIGGVTSTAYAVSGDGSTIVGSYATTAAGPDHAFLWRADVGMQDLQTVMAGVLPPGWSLIEARAVSGSGLFIAGSASGPGVSKEAFLATVPACIAPAVVSQPASRTVDPGAAASFSVTAGGFAPFTYQWMHNGDPLQGATFSTLTINGVTAAATGEYRCVVTNSCGNTMSAPATLALSCYANCDQSTVAPVLNVNDFVCFQTRFAAGDSYANCDRSTTPPVLNVNDFICFQMQFAAGCP